MITRHILRFAALGTLLAAVAGITPLSANGQEPCVLTCPTNITVPNDANQCAAVVNYPAPTSTGTCGTVICTPPSGSSFRVGTTTVTCTEDGPTGASCQFTVTVNDREPPVMVCPANITTGNDPDQCAAVVTYPVPTATDNCPGVTTVCTPPSGSSFPVGMTPTTCTATDAALNTASCTFNITVNDTQAPSITCPSDLTVPADFNGTAVVNYPPQTAADNCPGVVSQCTPPSGSTLPIGETTATCTATDRAGNTAICRFLINVIRPVPLLGGAGLVALVLIVASIGAWTVYRRRTTG